MTPPCQHAHLSATGPRILSFVHSRAHPCIYLRCFLRAGHSESRLQCPFHPYHFLCPHKLEGGFSAETSSSAAAQRPRALVLSLYSLDCHLLALLLCGGRPGAHDSWGQGRSLAGPSSITPLSALHYGISRGPEGSSKAQGFQMGSRGARSYLLLLKEKPAELDRAATQSGRGSAWPGPEGQAGQLLDLLRLPPHRLTLLPPSWGHGHTGWSIEHRLAP